MNTVKQPMYKWQEIPWRKLERKVFKLQKRIYKASSRGDVKTVRRLQRLLMKSWSAKCLSVRRVTQDNQGKKTAGVDGIKSLSPEARLKLVGQLKLGNKTKPTRRVWIPKPGREEKRPLGIPTIYDRALQALVKLALEPEWEARFESNSYGFRPGRSCHDAIEAIHKSISKKAKYVLDADISKCFDCINHRQLLEKLNTFPTLRRQIRAWLKAGVMDGKQLFPTPEGTPQGGVISPLLANIALHGMEKRIEEYADTLPCRKGFGKRDNRKSLNFIRYADDFIILHERLEVIQECQNIISQWLSDMGLELKPEKTRITHTFQKIDEEPPGFNFLGFNIRQYPAGKHTTARNRGGKLGFKTVITPSKKSQETHYQQIKATIDRYNKSNKEQLTNKLNPIIRGWSNYYSTVSSSKVFEHLDMLVFKKLQAWGNRRHPNKGKYWVSNKYWHQIKSRSWVFAGKEGKKTIQLIQHTETSIRRHTKVKGEVSPYNGNLIYWSTRMGRHPEVSPRVASLLRKQEGKCTHCGLHFKDGDTLEVDHKVPKSKGGKDEYTNKQLLHRHCHDEKTTKDGSRGTKSGCNSAKLKPPPRKTKWKWEEDMLVMMYA
jgi:RNA-directed DNA polymerase